jgi:hypothetical protein
MDYIPKLLGLISAILLALGLTETSQAPAPPPTTTSTTVVTTTTVEPSPTTTANSNGRESAHNRCGQWWGLAQSRRLGNRRHAHIGLRYVARIQVRPNTTQHHPSTLTALPTSG